MHQPKLANLPHPSGRMYCKAQSHSRSCLRLHRLPAAYIQVSMRLLLFRLEQSKLLTQLCRYRCEPSSLLAELRNPALWADLPQR